MTHTNSNENVAKMSSTDSTSGEKRALGQKLEKIVETLNLMSMALACIPSSSTLDNEEELRTQYTVNRRLALSMYDVLEHVGKDLDQIGFQLIKEDNHTV